MRVIVQIPCFNEEATLAQTVADIPRRIEGVEQVEILVIDDGSSDRTVALARELGVEHIVCHRKNKGLAASFRSGLERCLALDADIVVNTDGDNQYNGADIPHLIAPILKGEADIVVGDRQTAMVTHFSPAKRLLQALGSWVVRGLSGVQVPDAVSGFRAMSRDAALKINIVSAFSYTIEMLIQAGRKQMVIASVPVRTNPKTRESRLFTSVPSFVRKSVTTMLRIYSMYHPLRAFFYLGIGLTLLGTVPVLRFLYDYLLGDGSGKIQSLVLGGVLIVVGLTTFLIGLLADLISFNRQLIETTLEKVRRLELAQQHTTGAQNIAGQLAEIERYSSEWDRTAVPATASGPSLQHSPAGQEPKAAQDRQVLRR